MPCDTTLHLLHLFLSFGLVPRHSVEEFEFPRVFGGIGGTGHDLFDLSVIAVGTLDVVWNVGGVEEGRFDACGCQLVIPVI
jgi:hypothetical protein